MSTNDNKQADSELSLRNFSEDAHIGFYIHKCKTCNLTFYGHKHRPKHCKKCVRELQAKLNPLIAQQSPPMTPPDNSTHAMAKLAARKLLEAGLLFHEVQASALIAETFATLQKDKERLDWLERNLITIGTPSSPDMGGIRFVGQLRNEARGSGAGPSYFRVNHRDLREAIDAAMQPLPPSPQ